MRPVPAGDGGRRPATASSSARDLVLGQRLGQPRRHPGHLDVGRRVDRRGDPPRPGTGSSDRTATSGPGHLRRRPALGRAARRRRRRRRRLVGVGDAAALLGQPGRRAAAGRAGRPPACWPTGPARPTSQVRNSSTSSGVGPVATGRRRRRRRRGSAAKVPQGQGEPDDRLGVDELARRDHAPARRRAATRSTVMCSSSMPCAVAGDLGQVGGRGTCASCSSQKPGEL